MKYTGIFKAGAMELDTESDDLQQVKDWIVKLLGRHSNPNLATIVDEEREKVIFLEKNP